MICQWELQLHASLTLHSSSAGTSVSLAVSVCVTLSQPSLWCSSPLFFLNLFSLCPHHLLFISTTRIPTIVLKFPVFRPPPTPHPLCHFSQESPNLIFWSELWIWRHTMWPTSHICTRSVFAILPPLITPSPPSFPPVSPLQMCEDRGSPVIFSQSVTFSPEWKWNTTCVSVCFHAFTGLYLTTGQPERLADGFPSWTTLRWSERLLGKQRAARHLFEQNKWAILAAQWDHSHCFWFKWTCFY